MSIEALIMTMAVIIFLFSMLYAAVMDVYSMKISDKLCILLLIFYAVLAPIAGFGLEKILFSIAAALMVFFVSVGFFAMGWIGGGDGKLATATALWVGADQTLTYVTYAALFGGVLTVALLVFRRVQLPPAWRNKAWIARLHAPDTGVPYGVALAAAGLAVLGDTAWMSGLI